MYKKIITSFLMLLMTATVGFASPLTDYSQGKTSIDITWRPPVDVTDKFKYSTGVSDSTPFDEKKAAWDWRITSGLGNDWAIQYNKYDAFGKSNGDKSGVNTQELNVLHKVDKNFAAFAGYHWAKYIGTSDDGVTTPTKGALQLGLVADTEIAPKTNLYGIIGFGKDLINYEAGISYEVAKNLELNVNYRYKEVKQLSCTYGGTRSYKDDVTVKGVGYGITYKF